MRCAQLPYICNTASHSSPAALLPNRLCVALCNCRQKSLENLQMPYGHLHSKPARSSHLQATRQCLPRSFYLCNTVHPVCNVGSRSLCTEHGLNSVAAGSVGHWSGRSRGVHDAVCSVITTVGFLLCLEASSSVSSCPLHSTHAARLICLHIKQVG